MSAIEQQIVNRLKVPSVITIHSRPGYAGATQAKNQANIFLANLAFVTTQTTETVTSASLQSLYYNSNGTILVTRSGEAGVAKSANANVACFPPGEGHIDFDTDFFGAGSLGSTKNLVIDFLADAQGTVIIKLSKKATYNPSTAF